MELKQQQERIGLIPSSIMILPKLGLMVMVESQKKGDLTKGVQKAAVLNHHMGFQRIMRL